jgi:DNA-binding LytR/AlgR family response regulator
MKNFRCLIIDDEPLAIDVMENYLQRLDGIDIQRCENPVGAFKLLQTEKFDLIFLDIQMPFLTGIDFLKTVKNPPAVIITTAYRDYAVEGFELEVLDYLVKPVSFPRFMKAFEKALKHSSSTGDVKENVKPAAENEYIFLKVDRKLVKVLVKDILYIESLKDYIKVKTKTDTWVCYQTLTSVTEKLPGDKFVRVHRSFTIAIDKVHAIDGSFVEIEGKAIPISRELKQDFLQKIQKNTQGR